MPSRDTFSRVLVLPEPRALEKCYKEWAKTLRRLEAFDVLGFDVLGFDGETVRGAGSWGDEGFTHIVSACDSESGISIGQVKAPSKRNEIVAFMELPDLADVKDHIVTSDAMGCRKAIVSTNIENGAHYVIAVTENRSGLPEGCRETAKLSEPSRVIRAETVGDHGRVETRTYEVRRDLSAVRGSWNWAGLSAVVSVHGVRYDKKTGKETKEVRFYVASLPRGCAERIARAVRLRWSVETKPSRRLDMTFGEDAGRKRAGNAAENRSRLPRMAHAWRMMAPKRSEESSSLARRRKEAAWDTEAPERVLFGQDTEYECA